MTPYFIIPGLGNSGPQHWQTYFEQQVPNCKRIHQEEWDAPDCTTWITTIEKALANEDLSQVVLIGHSLGCSTIAFWAHQFQHQIKGALLVAPSDIEAPAYTFPSTGFSKMPLQKINFNTIVVASSNDPWVSQERAHFFAQQWGSEFVTIGDAGHINADSGHGEWSQGLELLKKI
jgi:uncharacterized protein